MICFKSFKFDPKQQLLFKAEQPVALTAKQAKLLRLFLDQPTAVLSKDDILDQVWDGRAVSEQVVFQNISALRTLIGAEAIKTFPKRGYQWQIPLVVANPKSGQSEGRPSAKGGAWRHGAFLMSLIAVVLAGLIIWRGSTVGQSGNTSTVTIALLPIEARHDSGQQSGLAELNRLIADENVAPVIGTQLAARDFLQSSYMVRASLELADDALLLSGMLRQTGGRYVLLYRLQGPYRSWQAYVDAEDIPTLAAAVRDQIGRLARSKFFALQDDALVTAELALLHDAAPIDAAILSHLIERHLEEANYDIAAAYIDKLATVSLKTPLPTYQTTALWLRGRRAIALMDMESARRYLAEAERLAGQSGLLSLQSEILQSSAEVAFLEQDFETIKDHLIRAASLARLAAAPVAEVRAYTLLSIMADKLGLRGERFEYLNHAKSLLSDGRFDGSHYMLINYHFALFADDAKEKENWYRVALAQPVTPENAWVFESAADGLVALLIADARWHDALEVVETVTSAATAHKLWAMIFTAQGDMARGIAEAREAFTLARINGNKWVAMPMALMLLEHSLADGAITEGDDYRHYLEANLKGRWKTWQRERLAKLGIS